MSKVQAALITISPEQCRAARAALGLTVLDVCTALGMGPATLTKFEGGGEVRASSADKLRGLFEARGVTFFPDGRGVSW
jgi:transcriptional regulator with XRE-family HTH domain